MWTSGSLRWLCSAEITLSQCYGARQYTDCNQPASRRRMTALRCRQIRKSSGFYNFPFTEHDKSCAAAHSSSYEGKIKRQDRRCVCVSVSRRCRKAHKKYVVFFNLSLYKEGDQGSSTESPCLLIITVIFSSSPSCALFAQRLCSGLPADRCAEITPSNWCQWLWDGEVRFSLVLRRRLPMHGGWAVMTIMALEWCVCCVAAKRTHACKIYCMWSGVGGDEHISFDFPAKLKTRGKKALWGKILKSFFIVVNVNSVMFVGD